VNTQADQQSDIRRASDAARCAPRRPSVRQILEFADSYTDDISGASALASAVVGAVRQWGIWWTADKAERLAYAQAAWLLTNFPEGGFLALHASYAPSTTWLSIVVLDAGSMLPPLDRSDEWRMSLGTHVLAYARHYDGSARELEALFKIRAPWRGRITWNTSKINGYHPEYTFEDYRTDVDAEQGVRTLLGRIGANLAESEIAAVHWQGPHDRDDDWREYGLGGMPTAASSSALGVL
jgi:hypothetical protein